MSVGLGWSWQTRDRFHRNHVMPVGDLKPHYHEDCWCAPRTEDEVVIHNSADHREFYERKEVVPS